MPRLDEKKFVQLADDFEKGADVNQLRDRYGLGTNALFRYLHDAASQGLVSDISRLFVDGTQNEFPANNELRLEALLNANNTELKIATQLMLDTRVPLNGREIRDKLSRLVTTQLPRAASFQDYCDRTLSDIALLVRKSASTQFGLSDPYFTVSQAGETFGRPLAAFSLVYGVDHNTSLYSLLGQTQSTGDSHAPYNRARIAELVSEGYDEISQLAGELNLANNRIADHLDALQNLGFLIYESLSFDGGGKKTYEWVEGRLPEEATQSGSYTELTKDVAGVMYRLGKGSCHTVAQELNYRHPKNVSGVLVDLHRQGIIQARFESQTRSEIVPLNDLSVFTNYLKPVRRALENGSELKAMEWMLKELEQDPKLLGYYLDAGMQLYRDVSPHIKTIPLSYRQEQMVDLIRRYQEQYGIGLRPTDIEKQLIWGKNIVYKVINSLGDSLKRERDGKAVRYSLK